MATKNRENVHSKRQQKSPKKTTTDPIAGITADNSLECTSHQTIASVSHAVQVSDAIPANALVKLKSHEVARRIRSIAGTSDVPDSRKRLRRLARLIIDKQNSPAAKSSAIRTAIGDCLDAAACLNLPSEKWLQCEAAAWALSWLVRTHRDGDASSELFERLMTIAISAQALLKVRDTSSARFVFTLARLFADVEACRCLEADVMDSLSEEICRLVSASGAVGLSGSTLILERVIRWTAIRELALAFGATAWTAETERHWAAAATGALRLLGSQGRVLTDASRLPASYSAPLLAACASSAAKQVQRTARYLERTKEKNRQHPQPKHSKKTSKSTAAKLLARDLNDSAAAVAVIRSAWNGRNDLRIQLEYSDATPQLEIAVGDRLVVNGPWQWIASLGGQPLDAEGPWTVSCWESDQNATYLEIIAPLGGDLEIERTVVMIPDDHIIILSDVLKPRCGADESETLRVLSAAVEGQSSEICYQSSIRLARSLEAECAVETREITVSDSAPRFLALPLALPEWRLAAGHGEFDSKTLENEAVDICFRQRTIAKRLFAPLWIDCNPARIGEPLTWRALTVADTRQNLGPQQAAAFRVQSGNKQWLLYRSLDLPRNRTVLGCNLACEFMIGRIGRRGIVSRIIEIQ